MSVNNISIRPLSWIKRHLVKRGRYPYQILWGVFSGLRLQLDLQHETQVYLGLWEQETYSYIRRAALSCKWAVDIGAGKGEMCIYLLRRASAEKILAFEPQTPETDIFKGNLALNGEEKNPRLIIHNTFVGTSTDPQYISLDALALDHHVFGFIKIDVDGYEMDVLKSGDQLFTYGNVGLLLETHSKELEDECSAWLQERGYTVKIIKNAWWRIIIPEKRIVTHNRWLWAVKA